jgi:hypothetical protein
VCCLAMYHTLYNSPSFCTYLGVYRRHCCSSRVPFSVQHGDKKRRYMRFATPVTLRLGEVRSAHLTRLYFRMVSSFVQAWPLLPAL